MLTCTEPTKLTAPDGSAVSIVEGPILETRDAEGRVVFQYDPVRGRSILRLPGGDVELHSVSGKVELVLPRDLRIRSAGTVEIAGDRGVRISSGTNQLALDPKRVALRAEETEFEGDRVTARARTVKVAWGKLEQSVGRLFTWAKNVYERVEELLHTRAGRMRTQTEDAFLVQSGRATLTSKEEVRIDGRSIHLG